MEIMIDRELAAERIEKVKALRELGKNKNFSNRYANVLNLYKNTVLTTKNQQELDKCYNVVKQMLTACNEESGAISALKALDLEENVIFDIMWFHDIDPVLMLEATISFPTTYDSWVHGSKVRLGIIEPDPPQFTDPTII